MGGLQGGCRRRRRPCGLRKTEDQLGAEPLPLSKIRDGSAERNERPRGAAVFDFRFRARYEPQLLLQSVYATRPDPLKISNVLSIICLNFCKDDLSLWTHAGVLGPTFLAVGVFSVTWLLLPLRQLVQPLHTGKVSLES